MGRKWDNQKKDNNMQLLSVVVPVYNTEKYLGECIESILNQTYQNLELILVNDGSTDNSGMICDGYKKADNRVSVIHTSNQGPLSARLTGIKQAIETAYPKTIQQRCIVHMIRNSVKFVSYKDLKEFCNDLKKIYTSKNEKQGYEELQKVKDKWKDKYIGAFKTWEENWDAICPFFQFSESIRKIMYTTNTIESLNRQFRKYTKTKSVFPTDMSLLKCLYLSTKNITKKWTAPYQNWGPILSELSIMFDGRI